jgi:hypothetical protein
MQEISSTYRAMIAVDIEGSAGRGDVPLLQGRRLLAAAIRTAADESDIDWDACSRSSHGDFFRLITPSGTEGNRLLDPFVYSLSTQLRAHNHTAGPTGTVRVRAAVHAGAVHVDDGELVGAPLEHLARLLDAPPLKKALAEAPPSVTVALLVSEHIHDGVVRHGYRGIDPATFRRIDFTVKETTGTGWLHLPGRSFVPADDGAREAPGVSGADARIQATNVATGNARVGQMIGRVGTQIGHVGGGVSFGDHRPDPAALRDQLLALQTALIASHRSGELDEETYLAADAELKDAERYVAAKDEKGRGKLLVALKKLRGLVEDATDLGSKILALITAVRGL